MLPPIHACRIDNNHEIGLSGQYVGAHLRLCKLEFDSLVVDYPCLRPFLAQTLLLRQ